MPDRHTPEFVYLLAKLGSTMPYRKAVALLRELLPLSSREVSYGNVRRRTLAVGDELEKRATDRAEYDEYGPGRNPVTGARQITVALDGTWVRADCSASGRQLHVIAGRIERNGQLGNRFAWVPEAAKACCAKMIRSALDDDGYTNETKLSVLADGGDGLSRVVHDGAKRAPITKLDWFHTSMRLRHIEQMTSRTAVLMADSDTERWICKQVPAWVIWSRSAWVGGSPFAGPQTAPICYCKFVALSSMPDSTSCLENGTQDSSVPRGPLDFVDAAACRWAPTRRSIACRLVAWYREMYIDHRAAALSETPRNGQIEPMIEPRRETDSGEGPSPDLVPVFARWNCRPNQRAEPRAEKRANRCDLAAAYNVAASAAGCQRAAGSADACTDTRADRGVDAAGAGAFAHVQVENFLVRHRYRFQPTRNVNRHGLIAHLVNGADDSAREKVWR
jgi:hypothetical protein